MVRRFGASLGQWLTGQGAGKITKIGLGLLVVGIFLFVSGHQPAEAWFGTGGKKKMKPPFPLPQVEMKSVMDDKDLALSQLKGSVMLVNFWATWCKPCVEEMPDLNRLHKDLAGKGFTVVGISLDSGSVKPVKNLAKKMEIAYPVVMGSNKIARQFGEIVGIPVTFLVDRQGTVVKRYDGPRSYESFSKDISQFLQ